MKKLLVVLSAVALFAVAVLAQASAGQSGQQGQQTGTTGQTATSGQQPGTTGQKKMTMDCNQMMAARQKMMDEMKAMDSRLDDLTQKMNSATGQAKVDATAAVVNELVTQRKTMRDRMEAMHGQMMRHMGEHMAMGGKGMADCPMMKNPM